MATFWNVTAGCWYNPLFKQPWLSIFSLRMFEVWPTSRFVLGKSPPEILILLSKFLLCLTNHQSFKKTFSSTFCKSCTVLNSESSPSGGGGYYLSEIRYAPPHWKIWMFILNNALEMQMPNSSPLIQNSTSLNCPPGNKYLNSTLVV